MRVNDIMSDHVETIPLTASATPVSKRAPLNFRAPHTKRHRRIWSLVKRAGTR